MTARFLVGDVFDRLAEIPDGSVDLVLTSPPFLALRSYLPAGHPDKAKEIGSEPTPAEFLDTLLALSAEWRRVLAPHGSIAVELGDTYSGSGGAGGDYNPDGLRAGQGKFDGSATQGRRSRAQDEALGILTPRPRPGPGDRDNMDGWPLAKSLAMIPELYAASLAYGRNLLTGQPSPAGRWRVRNFKPWIRSNPPVGALGDKERPATSYVTVATRATDRYFDLDAVRTPFAHPDHNERNHARGGPTSGTKGPNLDRGDLGAGNFPSNTAGAPPLDWWHHVDAILDDELDARAGKVQRGGSSQPGAPVTPGRKPGTGSDAAPGATRNTEGSASVGARGVHLRRRLEAAGILTTVDALDVSPKGYKGAHYAVWPPELVKRLLREMTPRRVCTTCGQPSRRITAKSDDYAARGRNWADAEDGRGKAAGRERNNHSGQPPGDHIVAAEYVTVGWSDCGCPGDDRWRPGHVLDPFAGSGTTLAVAVGHGRDATGIDLDRRNAALAEGRVGMFLEVDYGRDDAAG